jgi:DNA-binding IscR family transcriptional regulator
MRRGSLVYGEAFAVTRRYCDQGPLSIARLSEGNNVTRQAITKHLHALADAGLVRD